MTINKTINRIKEPVTGKAAINIFMCVFSFLCLVPLILLISISLSDETDIINFGFSIIPRTISISAYDMIFQNPYRVINGYRISIMVTIIGTFLGLIISSMLAYTLSRHDYKYRKQLSFFLFFTMLFSGGLVPWYILISKYLGLTDKIMVLVIPYLVGVWNVFLLRTYFQKIPVSLIESAKIDGANELRIFAGIILPLSTPSLATVGLFIALSYWNDWYLGLLFINKQQLYSLQMLLKSMMDNLEAIKSDLMRTYSVDLSRTAIPPSESMRMAMCLIAIGPVMILFPFIQKYFVSGLTVGSVKG